VYARVRILLSKDLHMFFSEILYYVIFTWKLSAIITFLRYVTPCFLCQQKTVTIFDDNVVCSVTTKVLTYANSLFMFCICTHYGIRIDTVYVLCNPAGYVYLRGRPCTCNTYQWCLQYNSNFHLSVAYRTTYYRVTYRSLSYVFVRTPVSQQQTV